MACEVSGFVSDEHVNFVKNRPLGDEGQGEEILIKAAV